ncbi:SPOR domain-containing protein [Comamonas sp. B-9]|uniref:SPOR domain-containing protein n=1 Tax=Comamonas sp. B-9 TaxID=1055192 RepID=UPI000A077361
MPPFSLRNLLAVTCVVSLVVGCAPSKTRQAETADAVTISQVRVSTNNTSRECEWQTHSELDLKNKFAVQVGAFGSRGEAIAKCSYVVGAGFKPIFFGTRELMSGLEITRLRIGPFTNRSDAELVADQAKKLGLPATVIRLQ